MFTIVRKAQVRWAGHVTHMADNRIPKQLFYGKLWQGKRTVGGQRKRFKDTLDVDAWESLASDHPTWRGLIFDGLHDQQRATGSEQPKKSDRRKKAERFLHRPTNLLTCATPADVGFTPGSALSATSGHTNRLSKLPDVMVIFNSKGQTTTTVVP